MSKKLSVYIISSVILTMCILAPLLMAYRNYQKRHFSCNSLYYIDHQDISMRVIFLLMFNGTEGIVLLTGEVSNLHGEIQALNRQVFFTFQERNNNYKLHSQKIIRESYDNVDDLLLGQLMSPFFYDTNNSIAYKITRLPNDDYLFSNGKIPLLYCHHI